MALWITTATDTNRTNLVNFSTFNEIIMAMISPIDSMEIWWKMVEIRSICRTKKYQSNTPKLTGSRMTINLNSNMSQTGTDTYFPARNRVKNGVINGDKTVDTEVRVTERATSHPLQERSSRWRRYLPDRIPQTPDRRPTEDSIPMPRQQTLPPGA